MPGSLHGFRQRAELVHSIDGPFWQEPLELNTLMSTLGRRIGQIARQTASLMPDVPDPIARLNIALRLWAGCLDTAKTIASQTNRGPNSPQTRAAAMPGIDARAATDAVYQAGVEAAPAFKMLRNEPYSMEGVPAGSAVRLDANQPGV
jgi:hypothetical protein